MRARISLTVLLLGSVWARADETQTIRKSYSGVQRVEVDNVWGSIRVTAYDGGDADVMAVETVRGSTAEEIARARQEVKLDMTQQGGTLRLFVDGPFRCNCRDGERGWRNGRAKEYEVHYDFEIRAPRGAAIWLRTVNNGELRVDGVAGDFDVENVNGGVELVNISGSGRARTVNGPVKATFRQNPRAQTSFGSINGEIDLVFQSGLAADLRLKTFNGRIYSDFMVDSLPARAMTTEKRGGKTVFRADRFAGARIGAGGPEIVIDGFNSDIRIRRGS